MSISIYNEYGSSETSIIAMEDKKYNWKISTDRLFIEILNQENEPVKNGETGKIVITDLYNKVFPFIRYEIGDYGSVVNFEKYPYLILQNLSGRISDTIILPSGKKVPGLSFYYISRSVFEKSSFIREFRIIQKKIDLFIFQIVSKDNLTAKEKENIINETEKYLEPGLKINFQMVDRVQDKYSGKIQHFFSELS